MQPLTKEDHNLKLLSNKYTGAVIILLILVVKIIQLRFLFDTGDDLSHQIMGTQNLWEGHGVSEKIVFAKDLSVVHFREQFKWPPGFSILFLPFYAICQQDYILGGILMNVCFALLLLLISRSILKLFDIPRSLINLFLLLSGIALYYFQLKASTDAFATAIFLLAIYFGFRILKFETGYLKYFTGITATLILTASIKYLYIPIVFILPVFIFYVGYTKKNNKIVKGSIITFLVLLLVLGSLLLWQKYSHGNPGYIQQTARGIHFDNLTRFHPYILAAFVNPETIAELAGSFMQMVFAKYLVHLLQWCGFILLWWFVIKKERLSFQQKGIHSHQLLFLALLLATGISILLGTLSVMVAPEKWDNGVTWTYVQEGRYYGVVHVMLALSAFILYHSYRNKIKRPVFLLLFLILLFLPEAIRGLRFTLNRISLSYKEEYIWQNELKYQKATAAVIEEQKRKTRISNVVIAGSSDWMTWRAALHTHYPMFEDVFTLNEPNKLTSSKPVLLVFILRKTEIPLFQPFLASASGYYAGSYDKFQYYALTVSKERQERR